MIDTWNPSGLDIYIHPGEYNSDIERVNEVVKQLDVNHLDKWSNQLIAVIATVDVDKKYNKNVYSAVTRKILKKLFPEKELAAGFSHKAEENGYRSNYKEAISYYDKAIDLEPYDADYYSNRAFAYYILDDNLSAVSDYTKAIELEPNHYKHYNMRGYNHSILNNYQSAVEDYNKAIKLKPKVADNYYDRGKLYYKVKKYQEAIDDYNQAIQLERDDYKYYVARGQVYHAMDKCREAINDYNKVFEIDPKMSDPSTVYYSRGKAYLSLRDYKNAINDFDKSVKLYPNIADYYNERGKAYYGLKDYQKAIDDYSKAIARLSDNPKYNILKADIYLNRAAAYKKVGRLKEAANDKQQANDLDPSQVSKQSSKN